MKYSKHLMCYESYCILGAIETVNITNEQGQTVTKSARIDTGSLSSRISTQIASELKLPVVNQKKVWSTLGEDNRTFVECQLNICGVEIKTTVMICDTSMVKHEVIIGRKDIEMVDGIIDLKKGKNTNNGFSIESPTEIPIENQNDIVSVIMTEDDLDILSDNDNVNIQK